MRIKYSSKRILKGGASVADINFNFVGTLEDFMRNAELTQMGARIRLLGEPSDFPKLVAKYPYSV